MDSSVKDIVRKINYLTPSRYISGRIVEYDIKSANISILKDSGRITEDDFLFLKNLPKLQREIEIGLRERKDPSIYKSIQEGIIKAKENLVDFNDINEDQIVRIANDAVYINNVSDLKYTKFGNYVEFKQKSTYDIYLNLMGVIVLLKYLDNGDIDVDIKGLGKNMDLHKNYMINTIVYTVLLLERAGVESALDHLSEICEKYLKRELDVNYYREFNPTSMFRLINNTSLGLYSISNEYKNIVDINYNYSILRELWSILVEIYSLRAK